MDLNNFLLDLHGDVRYDVVVEPGVMLLLRLPDFGNTEALGILERDVEHEPRLLLELLDYWRRDLVVLGEAVGLVVSTFQKMDSTILYSFANAYGSNTTWTGT